MTVLRVKMEMERRMALTEDLFDLAKQSASNIVLETNDENSRRRKVLIADDDDDSRTMLAFILEDEGWEVSEARDGREALNNVLNNQPDLLILDNRMPELTGSEVYQQLLAQEIHLAIVMVTAYSDLQELASSLGISYFALKPFDIPELLSIIESAYENSRR